MGLFSGIISAIAGKPKKGEAVPLAEYYTDPYYNRTQDFLSGYSENILKGEMPAWYKAIGETYDKGGMADYISEATGDLKAADLERSALRGTGRSGISGDTMDSIGNMSASLRKSDYDRAIEGRKWLMTMGLGGESDVRSAAMENQSAKNQYELDKFDRKRAEQSYLTDMANNRRAYNAKAIAGIGEQAESAFLNAMMPGAGSASSILQTGGAGYDPVRGAAGDITGYNPKPGAALTKSGSAGWLQKIMSMIGGA